MHPEPRPTEFDPVRLSKLLSFVLRHRPDSLGLALDAQGWVSLERLVERINSRGRLPFQLDREQVERLIREDPGRRFQLDACRIRARGGHSVAGVAVERPPDPPEFLFALVPPDQLDEARREGALQGLAVELLEDEVALGAAGPDREVLVIESGRAAKQGVVFEPQGEGLHLASPIPLKFVISLRHGYERQVSAGGVLVRGAGQAAEFALIRTMPREQEDEGEDELAAPAEIEDPRGESDRRRGEERRRVDLPPPGGVERRRGDNRRQRRRRRSAWGPQGRLELPKGKLEPGESAEQAAVRELSEELGLGEGSLVLRAELSRNRYVFRTPEGKTIFKTVHYFLLRCRDEDPTFHPRREEGIVGVEWWPAERAIAQVAFRNLQPILKRARELVQDAEG